MYVVNIDKLKGRITEKGFNNSSFSKAVGISRETLRSCLKDYSKIPYDILSKMATVLECTEAEAMIIFFAH